MPKVFKITGCGCCPFNGIDSHEGSSCYFYQKENSYSRTKYDKEGYLRVNKNGQFLRQKRKPDFCKVVKIEITEVEGRGE